MEARYLVNPLNNSSWPELTAGFLVGLVPAVVNAITFPKLGFALSVFTLQLRGVALCRREENKYTLPRGRSDPPCAVWWVRTRTRGGTHGSCPHRCCLRSHSSRHTAEFG